MQVISTTHTHKNNNAIIIHGRVKKNKSILLNGTHTPHASQVDMFILTLYSITNHKGYVCCWIFILFNYKTQSHMMRRGLECNALQSKPSIKSLIKLMSSGAPALMLVFPLKMMSRKGDKMCGDESLWRDCVILMLLKGVLSVLWIEKPACNCGY